MPNFMAISKVFTANGGNIARTAARLEGAAITPMLKQTASKLLPAQKNIKFIKSLTHLSEKESSKLYNYLPKDAQENFSTLISAGKTLGQIKTVENKILSGSLERFLKIYDKNAYSKMVYLERNFKNLEKADFKKILNAYKTPEKMALNKENIQKWLQQKETLKEYSQTLAKLGKEQAETAKQDIIDIVGIEPKCRSKSFESIYDKLSKEVLKGKNIEDLEAAKKTVRDLVGTRLVLDDVSPQAIQKITDNLCKGIENGKIKPYRISNYANASRRYLSDEQFLQIQKAAARKGIEIPRIESDQISVSGYVSAQMNIIHSNGIAGELQIRGNIMNKYAQIEHIPYDLRMGKNIGKNIPELEKFLEPVEEAVAKLKRNGLDKIYDKYIHDCYKYIRKYEEGKIKSAFKLPLFPKKLRDYSILKFENLDKVEQKMEAIKADYEKFALAA